MGKFFNIINREYEEQLPYIYWLCAAENIGLKTYTKLQSVFDSPREIFEASEGKLERSRTLSKRQLEKLVWLRNSSNFFSLAEKMKKDKIEMIVYEQEKYPERLKYIHDAPIALFVKGRLPEKNQVSVAVIGARACTTYGMITAENIGISLAKHNIAVVSGMARGIDSASQIATLEAGGYSLGVLGGGVDVVYPRESKGLYEELLINGGVISEHVPSTEPQGIYFALRNRLISGLSDVVCVVEAREKSGTMITIDSALEQGREVYVVPGRISDVASRGCLEMIKQGASMITDIDSFAQEIKDCYERINERGKLQDEFPFDELSDSELMDEEILKGKTISDRGMIIVNNLEEKTYSIEEIVSLTGLDYSEAVIECMYLSNMGLLSNLGASRFAPKRELMEFKKN